MNRNTIKYIVDIGLVLSFLCVFITGILKFPGLTRQFRSIYRILPGFGVSRVHDWSGIIMGILVLTHLALNFRWLVAMTKKFFNTEEKQD